MREIREYQTKLLTSNKNVVICNWKRGSGKTYTAIEKVIEKGGNCLYLTEVGDINMINNYCLSNKDNIQYYKAVRTENYIEIVKNNKKTKFICESDNVDFNDLREQHFNYIICDEYLPSSKDLKILDSMLCDSNSQIIVCITNNDIEYIQDINENKDINSWVNTNIINLMKEFSTIDPSEKNTIRRNSILDMIEKLNKLKEQDIDFSTGSKHWYTKKAELYDGKATDIQKDSLGRLNIAIECTEKFIFNLQKYIEDTTMIGCRYKYTLRIDAETVYEKKIASVIDELRKNNIVNNIEFGSNSINNPRCYYLKFEI